MASDNQPVRVGVIGVGGMARSHLKQLLEIPGVEVVALCDIEPGQIEKAKTQFPQTKDAWETKDYKELLAREDVDTALIATPHTIHFEQAMAAIDANKHVLLEKPMVCTMDHANALLKRLENYGKVFGIGYQRHAQSQFIYMKERIASGEMGKVTFINALQCQNWKKGTVGKWRQDPALSGGGQINDSGSHLLDIILYVTGLTVAEVSAFIDNCGTAVDINSALTIRFTNGAQGNISIVGDAPTWHEDITIWCENGIFFYRNGGLEVADADGKRTRLEKDQLPEGHNIDEDFIRAVRGQGTPAAPPVCGLRTTELTAAAWESAEKNGQPVRMN